MDAQAGLALSYSHVFFKVSFLSHRPTSASGVSKLLRLRRINLSLRRYMSISLAEVSLRLLLTCANSIGSGETAWMCIGYNDSFSHDAAHVYLLPGSECAEYAD